MVDATTTALTAPLSSGQCEFDLKSKVGGGKATLKLMWRDFKELATSPSLHGGEREMEREGDARKIKARCVRKLTVMNVFYIY